MQYDNDTRGITFFSRDQLDHMSFERLMRHRKVLRAVIGQMSRTLGHRCCELCNEYVGDDWENDVGQYVEPYQRHLDEVKDVLRGKPHRDSPKMRR